MLFESAKNFKLRRSQVLRISLCFCFLTSRLLSTIFSRSMVLCSLSIIFASIFSSFLIERYFCLMTLRCSAFYQLTSFDFCLLLNFSWYFSDRHRSLIFCSVNIWSRCRMFFFTCSTSIRNFSLSILRLSTRWRWASTALMVWNSLRAFALFLSWFSFRN